MRPGKHTVFLMLGSNMGDRQAFLEQAEKIISQNIGMIIVSSSIYETEPWGFLHKDNFLNRCLQVRTDLGPGDIISVIGEIEKAMGRKRIKRDYQERTIDIDILFYNDQVIEQDNLIIPHPLISRRRFVLVPLCEIAQGLIHPLLGQTMGELLDACEDKLLVKPLPSD